MNLINHFGRSYTLSVLTFGKYSVSMFICTAGLPRLVDIRIWR
jgi:hypothetical protein